MSEMDDETVRTWTVEVDWTCGSCGAVNPGMTGAERESLRCVTCGHERTESDTEGPIDPTRVLTGELDRKARAGANWTCGFCGASSRAEASECEVCGAEKDLSRAVRRPPWAPPKPAPDPVPEPSPTVAVREARPTTPRREPPPPEEGLEEMMAGVRDPFPWARVGAVLLAVAVLFGGGVFLCAPSETTVRVAAMDWERTRTLEERHEYEGEGWRSEAPAGVIRWHQCAERQDGTHACNPHRCGCHPETYDCNCTGGTRYDCNCRPRCRTSCRSNRNGSASCSERCSTSCSTCRTPRVCGRCSREVCRTCYDQCPTYRTWCRYRYERWDCVRTVAARGTGPDGTHWPDLTPFGADQRATATERYTVRYDAVPGPDTWTRNVTLTAYQTFRVGQRYRARYTRGGEFTLLHAEPEASPAP